MKSNQKEMIANLIKEGRLAKGFTQKELSELSNISVRSIQRIENAELVPRSFTLKTLAEILDLPFESFQIKSTVEVPEQSRKPRINKTQKIILSAGGCFIIILLAAAFIAQSPRFPETHFEMFNYSVGVVLVLTALLLFIWKK